MKNILPKKKLQVQLDGRGLSDSSFILLKKINEFLKNGQVIGCEPSEIRYAR
jgi:hypothetical protein